METQKRELATADNFVWIPTGNNFGVPCGMVGYWRGKTKPDWNGIERAIVEFIVEGEHKEICVNLNALYLATDKEIDEADLDLEVY